MIVDDWTSTRLDLSDGQRLAEVPRRADYCRRIDPRRRIKRCTSRKRLSQLVVQTQALPASQDVAHNVKTTAGGCLLTPCCAVTVQTGMPARVPNAASLAAHTKQLPCISDMTACK